MTTGCASGIGGLRQRRLPRRRPISGWSIWLRSTILGRRAALHYSSPAPSTAFPFDLFDLRMLDATIADDALACIDALRWGKEVQGWLDGRINVPASVHGAWCIRTMFKRQPRPKPPKAAWHRGRAASGRPGRGRGTLRRYGASATFTKRGTCCPSAFVAVEKKTDFGLANIRGPSFG